MLVPRVIKVKQWIVLVHYLSNMFQDSKYNEMSNQYFVTFTLTALKKLLWGWKGVFLEKYIIMV